MRLRYTIGLSGLVMLVWANLAAAETWPPNEPLTAAQSYAQRALPLMLAANDSVPMREQAPGAAPAPQFEPSLFSGSNVHLTLGLATIATALATAATAPDDEHATPGTPRETNGTHAKLAKTTVALAAATIASGLITHWDDFALEDGFTDPDNLHILFGVTGAALMAYAVNKSANSTTPVSHAGIAELGALGMVVGIKLTW
ncbi:MAG: hypothetical protein Fur0026_08050 [Sideroxydans sp.]